MHKITAKILFWLLIQTTLYAQEIWHPSSEPLNLTPKEKYFMQPIWSPDGLRIAVAGRNYQGIWIMDYNGQNLQRLTDDMSAGYKFAWSSDSKEIVARVLQKRGRRRSRLIKIYNINEKQNRVISGKKTAVYSLPKWTMNDTKVYFLTKKGIELIDSNKSVFNARLLSEIARPIVYSKQNRFIILDAQGEERHQIEPVKGNYLNTVLSPNGQQIAFEVLGGNMFVVNIDGTGLTDLGRGERPRWSPDNEWLAYMIPTDDGHQFISSDIYVIKVDGTGKTNLTDTSKLLEMNPDWSPDGQSIAYDERTSGRIYKLGVEKN